MLVKATKDITWGGLKRIEKGNFYIVYAIEKTPTVNYFVYKAESTKNENPYFQPDPLPFDKDSFELIADKISKDWQIKELNSGTVLHAPPEWFLGQFYTRAHDWDLEDGDYVIIKKYKKKYETIYSEQIAAARQ